MATGAAAGSRSGAAAEEEEEGQEEETSERRAGGANASAVSSSASELHLEVASTAVTAAAQRLAEISERLRAEFPKVFLILTSAGGGQVLPRAVGSFWRSHELPEVALLEEQGLLGQEEAAARTLALKLEKLLVYLRGHEDGLLEVRPSLLPGAGRGLFARRAAVAGAWLCVYRGTLVPLGKLAEAKAQGQDLDYMLGGFGLYSVDAKDYPQVLARYINDPFDAPERRNVRFRKLKGPRKALVIAERDIAAGEELYAEYGAGFWRARGVTLPSANAAVAQAGSVASDEVSGRAP